MKLIKIIALIVGSLFFQGCLSKQQHNTETLNAREIWTKEHAKSWYNKQGWLVGANFIPSTAVNQLEMWQSDTFDSLTIDKESGFAESLGMNTSRVFLHDLLFEEDSLGFYKKIDTFLKISEKHHIKPLFVLFDSCWDPFPKTGKQRAPKPFVHNSGWVQSPGYYALKDSAQYPRLEKYVKGILARFANDNRILGWDLWNEPDNPTGPSYEKVDLPDKVSYVLPLLKKTFQWARSVNPSQPLTSGVWVGDWSVHEKMKPIEKLQLEESDIISFHNYDSPEEFEKESNCCKDMIARLSVPSTWQDQTEVLFRGIYRSQKNITSACLTGDLSAEKARLFIPGIAGQKPILLNRNYGFMIFSDRMARLILKKKQKFSEN
ncbi:cellulase family glycosylhydrolase [Pseudarcicella hirudinis]|uniref:cellulase family glycosylhydrolase n=1 Tax=Pseudarcicella hirudinis TaxID=1079859 RepID=UPI0035EFEBDC